MESRVIKNKTSQTEPDGSAKIRLTLFFCVQNLYDHDDIIANIKKLGNVHISMSHITVNDSQANIVISLFTREDTYEKKKIDGSDVSRYNGT